MMVNSVKIGAVKTIFGGRNEYIRVFRIYCPMRVKFGIRELLVTVEFRENRFREGIIFMGVF